MFSKTAKDAIWKKSYEVAYACFRVAVILPESVSKKILDAAASLLEEVLRKSYESAIESLAVERYFIKLSADTGMLGVATSDMMLAEMDALHILIQSTALSRRAGEEVNLEGIFSKIEMTPEAEKDSKDQKENIQVSDSDSNPAAGNIKSEIRQAAILERIRQIDNCRIKDIQEILPECSERTLRYDLQELLEKNLIERIGNGGPAVYYRIRQTA